MDFYIHPLLLILWSENQSTNTLMIIDIASFMRRNSKRDFSSTCPFSSPTSFNAAIASSMFLIRAAALFTLSSNVFSLLVIIKTAFQMFLWHLSTTVYIIPHNTYFVHCKNHDLFHLLIIFILVFL